MKNKTPLNPIDSSKTHNEGSQSEAKNKKKPPLNVDAFNGIRTEPEPVQYDKDKVGYEIWDFRIKFPKNGEPIGYFLGIYRNGFIDFLFQNGFCKMYRPDGNYIFLRCINNTIEEIEIIEISDFLINHLETKGKDITFDIQLEDLQLSFTALLLLQKETIKRSCHSLFNTKFLELLPNFEKDILKDTATTCYKLFKNKICCITKDRLELINYKDLQDKFVWRKHIIDFEFNYTPEFETSHFYKFINNVSNAFTDEVRMQSFKTAIGYLLHNYNSPEKGQAILCYDEVITDINKPQGGTGKGILAQALERFSEMVKIDGKKFDENNRFAFQRIMDSTEIVFFDDVKSKLSFDRFNSILTDGWNIEKKNKDEIAIKPEDSPKILITSNSILECEGTTRKRRQFILVFSNFYSRLIVKGNEKPIKDLHGCIFFSKDWDNNEWQMFYSFLIDCIQEYLKSSLVYSEPKGVLENRLRQTTDNNFAEWVKGQNFETNKIYEIKPIYEEYKQCFYPDELFTQRKFTSFIRKYADLNDLQWSQPKPSDGKTFFKLLKYTEIQK